MPTALHSCRFDPQSHLRVRFGLWPYEKTRHNVVPGLLDDDPLGLEPYLNLSMQTLGARSTIATTIPMDRGSPSLMIPTTGRWVNAQTGLSRRSGIVRDHHIVGEWALSPHSDAGLDEHVLAHLIQPRSFQLI